jgi:hypothetical protein
MNRGRIQAQGNNTEKSAPWATNDDHTKNMGLERVANLQNQLTPAELNLRILSLDKCRDRINTTPSYGVSAQMKKSFYDDFRNRQIRVDIEVNAGSAFLDDPNNNNNQNG